MDTHRVTLLNLLGKDLSGNDPDTARTLTLEAMLLSQNLKYEKGVCDAYNLQSWLHTLNGDFYTAKADAEEALLIAKKINYRFGESVALGNMGIAYKEQGDFPKALEAYLSALRIAEDMGNKAGISRHLGNIGAIYRNQANFEKAIEYYKRALKIAVEIGSIPSQANQMNNIGTAYFEMDDYPRALEYYLKALEMFQLAGNKRNAAISMGNIGGVYDHLHDYKKALEYYFSSLRITEEVKDESTTAVCLGSIGRAYVLMKEYKKAEEYLQSAIALCDKTGKIDFLAEYERSYYLLDSARGDRKGAFGHYKNYIAALDSVSNEENTKKQTQVEMQYEFDKKESIARAEQEQKDAVAAAESRRQRIILFAISGFGLLVLGFAFFAYRSFLQKKKANEEITKQKHLIEEKQKEILDSIYYARRIQSSLMPNEKYVGKTITRLKGLLCLFLVLFGFFVQAQQSETDSLLALIKKDKEDTNKANHLHELARAFEAAGDLEKVLTYAEEANALAVKLNFKRGIANANNSIGNVYRLTSEYPKALDHYLKALKIDEELNDKNGIRKRFNNMGIVYRNQGDYPRALDYSLKALKINEEMNDKSSITKCYSNIGIIYHQQDDFAKALVYYLKGLKIAEELGNKSSIAAAVGNIGSVYYNQQDYPRALEYYSKALKLGEELGDKKRISIQLSNIASVYYDLGNDSTAASAERDRALKLSLDYFLRSLPLKEEQNDKGGIAITLGGIGSLYLKTGKYKEAEEYLKRAIDIDTGIGALDYLRQYELLLAQLYEITGRHKLALEHCKIAMALKDTLFNQEKDKELTRKEMNYEFEKKEVAAQAEQDKKDAVMQAEARKQRFILILVSCVLSLVALTAFVIFRSLRVTRRQKHVIEHQKELVEEKQKEILDSIYYARRIQSSLMPREKYIDKHLRRLKNE